MAELLSAMISVLFAWSGLGLIFIGLGLFIRRSFGLTIQGAGKCRDSVLDRLGVCHSFLTTMAF